MNRVFIAHPDTANFYTERGGLFTIMNHPLRAHIGRKVIYIRPTSAAELEVYTIVHLQRLYDGSIGYRLTCESDTMNAGRPASTTEVRFI